MKKIWCGNRRIAVPSWVMPGGIGDNCVFLNGKVDEIALVFFESEACLAYTDEDLPSFLTELPLSYHLHLPLDLPEDARRAADICLALLCKTAFLASPGTAHLQGVLHPQCTARDMGNASAWLSGFLGAFIQGGGDPRLLLLENLAEDDLSGYRGVLEENDLGICLDIGHALTGGQDHRMSEEWYRRRVRMVHVNCPDNERPSGHAPLTALDAAMAGRAESMLLAVPATSLVVLELFSWEHIMQSLPILQAWLLPGK